MASEVIKLNLIPTGEMPVFHCSQFDNGRLITIELYRGEDAYEVPVGYTVELHCRKVDNNIVTLASTLVNTNVVTFTSTTQLTACNGKNLCEVAIKAADDYLIGTLNFWLEVEIDPLKGGINSTSEIHDLYDQIEDITAEVIGDNYYDKTEVDTLLDDKADKSTTYTKTEVDTLLTSKADKSNVYTKSETNTLLSAKADADDVYTKAQVETKLAAKADAASVYTKDETDTLLDAKANANAIYTKVEVDAMVDDIEDAIDLKADAATTYTKTEVDSALALKANAATTYTKTEVDTALALKANATDVYSKTQVDNIILDIMPVDTASGATAEFNTQIAAPLVSVIADITATGGDGTPASPIPIVGYSQAVITVNGDDITISLGQTVYGGKLDVTKGKLTITWIRIDLGNLTWQYRDDSSPISQYFYANYTGIKRQGAYTTQYTNICEAYPVVARTQQTFIDETLTFDGDVTKVVQIQIKNSNYSDPDVFKTSLTGVHLAFEAVTPVEIDLTPEVISAISGANTVSSDTGNIEVKYKTSIQDYIDSHTGG